MADHTIAERIKNFDAQVRERLNEENFQVAELPNDFYLQEETEIERDKNYILSDDEYADMLLDDRPDLDGEEQFNYDELIGVDICVDRGGELVHGKVVKRAKNDQGPPIGVRTTTRTSTKLTWETG